MLRCVLTVISCVYEVIFVVRFNLLVQIMNEYILLLS